MANLKNTILEKLKAENKISHLPERQSYEIHLATSQRMEKYSRAYSKKDKASHIAAAKVLLTS